MVKPILGQGKYMFFQLLSTIQVNIVAKITQSANVCVIFHVKHKKSAIQCSHDSFALIHAKVKHDFHVANQEISFGNICMVQNGFTQFTLFDRNSCDV